MLCFPQINFAFETLILEFTTHGVHTEFEFNCNASISRWNLGAVLTLGQPVFLRFLPSSFFLLLLLLSVLRSVRAVIRFSVFVLTARISNCNSSKNDRLKPLTLLYGRSFFIVIITKAVTSH